MILTKRGELQPGLKLRTISLMLVLMVNMGWGSAAFGHGGGLDDAGCHNDNVNGGYHCHRSHGTTSDSEVGYEGVILGLLIVGGIVWYAHQDTFEDRQMYSLDHTAGKMRSRNYSFSLAPIEGNELNGGYIKFNYRF